MKTALFLSPQSWQSDAVLDLAPQLLDLGWKLCGACEKHDVILVHQDHIGDCILNRTGPIVILERIDGCQLSGPTRRNIMDPRVRLVLKSSTFSDPQNHNRFAGRAFAEPENRPKHPISDADLAKIRLSFSYASCKRIIDFAPSVDSWPAERPIRCSFAGTTLYSETYFITQHRKECIAALNKIEGCKAIDGRRLEPATYWELLSRSMCTVSPYGCGEICWRDYESILAGCVLIRPNFGYGVATPEGIIESFESYQCLPDWSNLQDAIFRWGSYPKEKIKTMKWMATCIRSMNTPEAIAKRLAGFFEEAVG